MTLKDFTNNRLSWVLLLIFSWGFVAAAVSFQYFFDKMPCYLCIIQRIALLIIGFSALIALVNPKNIVFRSIGYLGWFSGSFLGLFAANKLLTIQSTVNMFSSCSMNAKTLLENYGWLDSLPILFKGSGDCTISVGSYFGFTFEQWAFSLFVIHLFSIYTIIFLKIIEKYKNKK